jgi:uncharacterized OB-fold protein
MAEGSEPIRPTVDELNKPFWDGAASGELRLQRCVQCRRVRYPVSDTCPSCLSPEATWETMSGDGAILSWVVFHQGYQPAWAARTPYNVVLVQLPEGPRMFGNVEPLGRTDLAVGAALRVTFVEDGGVSIPRWRLAEPAGG